MNGSKLGRILYSLAKEVVECWKNQDMPYQSYQCVSNKLDRLARNKSSNTNNLIFLIDYTLTCFRVSR